MQNKNILITGASGVLAQKLIKELLKEDYNIYALTRKINNETNTNGINYFLNSDFFNNKLDNITFDTVINCAFTQQMIAETVSDWAHACMTARSMIVNITKCLIVAGRQGSTILFHGRR